MRGFRVARIFGIPIELHWTWFIVFILISANLSMGFFPMVLPEISNITAWIFGILTSMVLFVSVLFHELSHVITARAFKIPTEKIVLFFLGAVAYLKKEPGSPLAEFWIAVAGPLANFILAGVFLFVAQMGSEILPCIVLISFSFLAVINGAMAIFNLIPAFPLDGGRIWRAMLWWVLNSLSRATRIAAIGGKCFGILFIVGGVSLIVFNNIWGTGLWLIFIGLFLFSIARESY